MIEALFHAPTWVLMIAIFLTRILDQTFTVLRTVSIIRGMPLVAAVCGFFEVLVWINVAGQVIRNLDNWYLTIVYAAGFAAGNSVGIWFESRIALGYQMVRVIARREIGMGQKLTDLGFPVTWIEGKSKGRDVEIVMLSERRKNIPQVCRAIDEIDAEAFYTVADVKQVGLRRSPRAHWWRG